MIDWPGHLEDFCSPRAVLIDIGRRLNKLEQLALVSPPKALRNPIHVMGDSSQRAFAQQYPFDAWLVSRQLTTP